MAKKLFSVRVKYDEEKIVDEKADFKKMNKLFTDIKNKFK